MKKREKKLQIHRETLQYLETKQLTDDRELAKAAGAIDHTGCVPNCGQEGAVIFY